MAVSEPPPLITECPNCHTRFRVGESQLQIAHGRVRCGACLAVFAGVDHLLLDDETPTPELTGEGSMLESVLAELAEEEGGGEQVSGATAASSAREFELDALAAKRADTLDDANPAPQVTREPQRETAEPADWTEVSVDTAEFGPRVTLELAEREESSRFDEPEVVPDKSSRVTMEEALNDEDALRWWLEDELPGEMSEALDDDGMVVQLSQLDAVGGDESLDLRELIGASEDESARKLAALFEELTDESPSAENESAAANAEVVGSSDALDREEPGSTGDPTPAPETDLDGLLDELEAAGPLADEADLAERADEETANPGGTAGSAAEEEQPAEAGEPAAAERATDALQTAIDEAEPLVTRAVANGALGAKAAKAAKTAAAAEARAAADQLGESVALVEPPVPPPEKAEPPVPPPEKVEPPEKAEPPQSAEAPVPAPEPEDSQVPAAEPVSWNSASFPETPAELVSGITEELQAEVANEAADAEAEAAPGFAHYVAATRQWLSSPLALRTGTVLAFALLAGQVLYSQFDDWSKSAAMRPVYAGLCSVLGCTLPERRSVADLQSRKLAVRSHPDKPGTLLVDALIINEAEFPQPFPAIELQFMDLQQQTVGSYRLEPADYLDGELAGAVRLMAVRTPVHIDIEIADPGPRAVNYQLQFR